MPLTLHDAMTADLAGMSNAELDTARKLLGSEKLRLRQEYPESAAVISRGMFSKRRDPLPSGEPYDTLRALNLRLEDLDYVDSGRRDKRQRDNVRRPQNFTRE